MIGGDAPPEPLIGSDEIGESRDGSTLVEDNLGESMRWDIAIFRRGEIGEMLFLSYPDGTEPVMPIQEIARLLDERLIALQD